MKSFVIHSGKFRKTTIGYVYAADADDWDKKDKIFTIVGTKLVYFRYRQIIHFYSHVFIEHFHICTTIECIFVASGRTNIFIGIQILENAKFPAFFCSVDRDTGAIRLESYLPEGTHNMTVQVEDVVRKKTVQSTVTVLSINIGEKPVMNAGSFRINGKALGWSTEICE